MGPKIALVTGTNTGIGLAISVKLCQVGFITYASVRSLAKADALQKAAATAGVSDRLKVIEMDVGDDASVISAVKAVLADTGNIIDVVISNAGYMDTSSRDGVRRRFGRQPQRQPLRRRAVVQRGVAGNAGGKGRALHRHLLPGWPSRLADAAIVRVDKNCA